MITFLHENVRRLAAWGGYLAGVILVLMVGHVLLEIVLRTFFATSTYVLDEFVGYGVAAMTFLSTAYALRNGALIRVNILLDALPGGGVGRRSIELLCVLLTMSACGLIAVFFGNSAWRHFTRGTVSETVAEVPMWIPEGFVLVGLVILELELFSYALRIVAGDRLLDDGGEGVRKTSTE